MGSPVSVTVANLIMEDVEERALSTFHSDPIFWKRYVWTVMQDNLIQEFKEHLNLVEPSIKFTVEMESCGKLAFLDTDHDDGKLNNQSF